MEEPEGSKECYVMMSPGHDMAPAQEQSQYSSQNARRDHELRIIGDCWLLEDRVIFFFF